MRAAAARAAAQAAAARPAAASSLQARGPEERSDEEEPRERQTQDAPERRAGRPAEPPASPAESLALAEPSPAERAEGGRGDRASLPEAWEVAQRGRRRRRR
ncbi:MAG TPA: hypothetical protein VEK83_14300 [Gemmatimonadales bacterium]|nr:hypothetical protein [Gemmatimonadales bacterium]